MTYGLADCNCNHCQVLNTACAKHLYKLEICFAAAIADLMADSESVSLGSYSGFPSNYRSISLSFRDIRM